MSTRKSSGGVWTNILDPFGKLHCRIDWAREIMEIRVRGKTVTHDLRRLREEALR